MNVDPNKASAKFEHAGRTYYFCAPGCAERFQQAPEKYLSNSEKASMAPAGLVNLQAPAESSRAGAAVAPAPQSAAHSAHHHPASHHEASNAGSTATSGTQPQAPASAEQARYTSPIHPEIVQVGPGTCPICGMALEPMDVFAEVEADPEYDSIRRRFWVSAALSLPVLDLPMFGEPLGLHAAPASLHCIELALPPPV